MRRVEQLITMARQLSGNTRYDKTSGVPQSVFVQYANNAQDTLMKNVVNIKTKFLKKEIDVNIVAGQELYPYPSDIYIQNLDTIQWLSNQDGVYYQTLYKSYTKEKVTTTSSYPFSYIPMNNGYELNPPIRTGFLRVTYIKKLPKLQVKNGQINAVAFNTAGNLIALTIDTNSVGYDSCAINDDYFMCVVDKHGEIKASNVEYNSESSGIFSIVNQPLASGNSISVGDYIIVGKNSTNLPQWPDICESYLIDYMNYSAKWGDSSQWSQEAKDYMQKSFADLAISFAMNTDDITQIPITNIDLIGF